MLDPNALAQLSQLKSTIQAAKDYAEGTVAATTGRFGFVRTDDGRDAFLSPEKMERVLPGDRVKISVITNEKGKFEAELENLLSSDLSKFVGQYRVRGAGHFVVPIGQNANRWIFIPPNQRKNAKEGEYVVAKLARHPFKDGRAQANIVYKIGAPDSPYIEHKFVKAKYDFNYRAPESLNQQVKALQARFESEDFGEREDLSEIPFFTIDAASTLDMDDALAIERHDEGYRLLVAIADPASFFNIGSALEQQARASGQSIYLLGGTVPMLPASLAHNAFSLEAGKRKPALVCDMLINGEGAILSNQFKRAIIRSHHKLSYEQVAKLLDENDQDAVPAELHEALQQLLKCSTARRQYREQHYLLSEDQPDYEYQLDERGHITAVAVRTRNSAQQVVEEAMIACNRVAGELLREHKLGLHAIHTGFREERLGEVKALLKEESLTFDDINSLDNHLSLIKTLAADGELSRLLPALRRMMLGSELSTESSPHLSMGVPAYATLTSPIRRYADLFNHWSIHAILSDNPRQAELLRDLADAEFVSALNECIRKGRQADRELQQWLCCIYAHEKLLGQESQGLIRIVTQQGYGVKLHDSGIEGFVLLDKELPKTFDAKRLTLTVGEHVYRIGDHVSVKLSAVDMDKRRIAMEALSQPTLAETQSAEA